MSKKTLSEIATRGSITILKLEQHLDIHFVISENLKLNVWHLRGDENMSMSFSKLILSLSPSKTKIYRNGEKVEKC